MRSLADTVYFILVYPQGTLINGDPHWNAGLRSDTNKCDADDFGFSVVRSVGSYRSSAAKAATPAAYPSCGGTAFPMRLDMCCLERWLPSIILNENPSEKP